MLKKIEPVSTVSYQHKTTELESLILISLTNCNAGLTECLIAEADSFRGSAAKLDFINLV